MKILFGPAGLGTPAIEGLEKCENLGLGAAEVEFIAKSFVVANRAKQLAHSIKMK
jgi:hypothetical protein